jgi:hypothetical protein
MATLVFTAVGTALGGPMGGAIGSLLGQSLDQQLFGSARRGPRLGDLSVQTSSYGTPIPRISGSMRVAGSVIWATDLTESAAQTGAKGQPETTVYSYAVSFAVALSSRVAGSIGRIWADGKLLRGAAGDFKVATEFRFLSGDEDQEVDPLIASVEGIANTPAHRGLAVAVFENLQLAEYGNRIPFLTFEVIADAAPVSVGEIVGDASGGLIACDAVQPVVGFAAYGSSIRAAVEPLVERFGLALFDDGETVRSVGEAALLTIGADELGCSSTAQPAARIELTQAPARSVPAALALTFYDPARDYQAGQVRATAGEQDGRHESAELPVVIQASSAKGMVQAELARRWAARDQLTLRLPPRCIGLQPGRSVEAPDVAGRWTVERCTIEGSAVIAELTCSAGGAPAIAADPGRASLSKDVAVSETRLALFDLPGEESAAAGAPVLHLAASNAGGSWRPVGVELTAGNWTAATTTASRKAVLGTAVGVLGPGQPELIDQVNAIEIALVDPEQWLQSRSDDELVTGANLAALGGELFQFGIAEPIAPGRFRLSRLLRGRRGTEFAASAHSAGDPFVLIDAAALQRIVLEPGQRGSVLSARPLGLADGSAPAVTCVASGEALRPPSPAHLCGAMTAAGALSISWVRRSRLGWAWVDEIDAPLGETIERYRVSVEGGSQRIDLETVEGQALVSAAQLAGLGASLTVSVQQLGDQAASRAAQIAVTL